MLKVHVTLSRKKHAQEINAGLGRPFAQREIIIRYSQLAIRTRIEKQYGCWIYTITRCRTEAEEYGECVRWAMYDVFRRCTSIIIQKHIPN